jgi:S-adenosylmethionine:tRNA ribosyltransferase-isomerase
MMITASTPTPKDKGAKGKGGDLALPVLDFELPAELEAREPAEARGIGRDGVRLLVTHVASDRVEHLRFREIGDALAPGDVLVVNTSATLPAALEATAPDGTPLELHLSTRATDTRWIVELRTRAASGTTPYFEARAGDHVALPAGGSAALEAPLRRDARAPARLWHATLDLPAPLLDYLDRYGFPIRYGYVESRWPIALYQTAFAEEPGSAEMPSAGRAFTPELVTRLVARGVQVVPLLLHTGVSSLEAHEAPYAEWYRVPEDSARRITEARAAGRRIIAVGTTVVRALETVTDGGATYAGEGWTERIVTPKTGARSVDGLLTGLHEPRASHLAMLEAIAGRRHLEVAYAAALGARYLWHEFGDLHLILP